MTTKFRSELTEAEKPKGKIIYDFLQWAVDNDYIYFDHLLEPPENINVTMDIAEKLIIDYLING